MGVCICGHMHLPIQLCRKQACAGVLSASAQSAPTSSIGEMSSQVDCQPSQLPGRVGASALPFLLAEPCPVQAAAEDRCQGGSVSIWPERLDGELAPLAPQGPAGPCWMGLGDAWAMSFADEMNDHHQNTLSYVLINPPPDTRLEPNDIV